MGHFLQHCRRRSSTSACGVQRALQLASHLAALQSPLAPRSHRLPQPTVQMTSATLLTASRCKCFSSPVLLLTFYHALVVWSPDEQGKSPSAKQQRPLASTASVFPSVHKGSNRRPRVGKKSWHLLKEILFMPCFTSTSLCIMDLASLQEA